MFESLREFQVLAAHLNYTTAAHELCMSQSSLSRHINDLEEELGFPLFDKYPVRLTVAGDHYLEGISKMLTDYDSLVRESKGLFSIKRNSISVAMMVLGGSSSSLVYDTFASLKDTYPNLDCSIYADRRYTLIESVERDKADVGLLRHKPDRYSEDLTIEWLYDEPYVAWIHEDNDLPDKLKNLAALAPYTLASSTNKRFENWTEHIREGFREHGLTPMIRIKNADSFEDLLVSLQKDEFLLMPEKFNDLERYNKFLRKIEFTEKDRALTPLYIAYKEESQNPVVEAFVDLCHQAAKLNMP